jgi:hypothetical protein
VLADAETLLLTPQHPRTPPVEAVSEVDVHVRLESPARKRVRTCICA